MLISGDKNPKVAAHEKKMCYRDIKFLCDFLSFICVVKTQCLNLAFRVFISKNSNFEFVFYDSYDFKGGKNAICPKVLCIV